VILFLGGCAGNQPLQTQEAAETQADSPSLSQSLNEEGKSLCETIAQDLSNGDHQSLNRRFDTSAILARINSTFEERSFTPEQLQNFEKRLNQMIPGIFGLGNDQIRWDMLHGHVEGERYLCLIRTNLSDEGLSYVEFELTRKDGRLRIVDWYDLVRETKVSDLFSDMLHDSIEMTDAHIMAMPYQRQSALQEQRLFFNFLATVKSADPRRVLMAYDNLPPRMKRKPVYTLIAINMASRLDDAQYERVLRNLSQLVGDSGHYSMLLIDLYMYDQEYDKAKRAIYSFKRQVGTDPLLDLLLADLDLKQGNKQGFYHYCLQALNNDPNYLDTYWLLLDRLVADRHYEDAVLVLNVLTKRFEYTIKEDAIESMEQYRDFCKSAAYKAWKSGTT
jgi:hypothetical protein